MSDGRNDASMSLAEAQVAEVHSQDRLLSTLSVRFDSGGDLEPAVAYRTFTPELKVGDRVLVNTTAVELGLGTGGVHFVVAVWNGGTRAGGDGHIMKLRYTPLQFKVASVEEAPGPYHEQMASIPDLGGKPVLVGSLHSMVPVAAAVVKAVRPDARAAYVMTDGAALPAAFSRLIREMRDARLIDGVITAGHAFGGDLESVNPISAIAAAHAVLRADVVIVAMGPGVVGTGTALGTTALEQGPLLDAAYALGGTPIAIARLSGADKRIRHRGLSHHTATALTRFTHVPAFVPLPDAPGWTELLKKQAEPLAAGGRSVVWEDGSEAYRAARCVLEKAKIKVTTMGRSDAEDPLFFWGVGAAAMFAAGRL